MYKSLTVYLRWDNKLAVSFNRDGEVQNHALPLSTDWRMTKRAFALMHSGYTCRPYTGALGYVMEKEG